MKNFKISVSLIILFISGILVSCNQKSDMEKEETRTLTSTTETSIDVHDHRNVKRVGMVIKI